VTNLKPKRDPEIETNILPDGHVVLVSPKTEWANTLNPLAALVWEFCDGENTPDDIVAQVLSVNLLPKTDSLKAEVTALISELEESGFLLGD